MSRQSHKARLAKLEATTPKDSATPVWFINVVSPNPAENQRFMIVDGVSVEVDSKIQ